MSASFEHRCPNGPHHLSGSAGVFFLQRESKEDCRKGSVVDPHWLQCGYGSSILGQCGYRDPETWWPNITRSYSWKKLDFLIKNCIFGDLWRTSKLQEKPPTLKGEHPALQKQYISSLFPLFLWFIFAHPDPDPDPIKINAESDPHNEERSSLFTSHFTGWLIFDCCTGIYARYSR